jgi:hypothetical protein
MKSLVTCCYIVQFERENHSVTFGIKVEKLVDVDETFYTNIMLYEKVGQ